MQQEGRPKSGGGEITHLVANRRGNGMGGLQRRDGEGGQRLKCN